MAKTYEKIATTTSSGGSSISFTSIPATYTDLVLIFVGTTGGGVGSLQYNGDTGTNYSVAIMWGNGSGPAATRYDAAYTYAIPDSSTVMTQRINIQNYSNSTTFKTSISRVDLPVAPSGPTAGAQIWRNTSAINRVDLVNSGTFGSYTATLYGIKAA
jgi:hypothetical protein